MVLVGSFPRLSWRGVALFLPDNTHQRLFSLVLDRVFQICCLLLLLVWSDEEWPILVHSVRAWEAIGIAGLSVLL